MAAPRSFALVPQKQQQLQSPQQQPVLQAMPRPATASSRFVEAGLSESDIADPYGPPLPPVSEAFLSGLAQPSAGEAKESGSPQSDRRSGSGWYPWFAGKHHQPSQQRQQQRHKTATRHSMKTPSLASFRTAQTTMTTATVASAATAATWATATSSTTTTTAPTTARRRPASFLAPLWDSVRRLQQPQQQQQQQRSHRRTLSAADTDLSDKAALAHDGGILPPNAGDSNKSDNNMFGGTDVDDVVANYQKLMASGFFQSRAIPASRAGLTASSKGPVLRTGDGDICGSAQADRSNRSRPSLREGSTAGSAVLAAAALVPSEPILESHHLGASYVPRPATAVATQVTAAAPPTAPATTSLRARTSLDTSLRSRWAAAYATPSLTSRLEKRGTKRARADADADGGREQEDGGQRVDADRADHAVDIQAPPATSTATRSRKLVKRARKTASNVEGSVGGGVMPDPMVADQNSLRASCRPAPAVVVVQNEPLPASKTPSSAMSSSRAGSAQVCTPAATAVCVQDDTALAGTAQSRKRRREDATFTHDGCGMEDGQEKRREVYDPRWQERRERPSRQERRRERRAKEAAAVSEAMATRRSQNEHQLEQRMQPKPQQQHAANATLRAVEVVVHQETGAGSEKQQQVCHEHKNQQQKHHDQHHPPTTTPFRPFHRPLAPLPQGHNSVSRRAAHKAAAAAEKAAAAAAGAAPPPLISFHYPQRVRVPLLVQQEQQKQPKGGKTAGSTWYSGDDGDMIETENQSPNWTAVEE